jgi:hypothetical protein
VATSGDVMIPITKRGMNGLFQEKNQKKCKQYGKCAADNNVKDDTRNNEWNVPISILQGDVK